MVGRWKQNYLDFNFKFVVLELFRWILKNFKIKWDRTAPKWWFAFTPFGGRSVLMDVIIPDTYLLFLHMKSYYLFKKKIYLNHSSTTWCLIYNVIMIYIYIRIMHIGSAPPLHIAMPIMGWGGDGRNNICTMITSTRVQLLLEYKCYQY